MNKVLFCPVRFCPRAFLFYSGKVLNAEWRSVEKNKQFGRFIDKGIVPFTVYRGFILDILRRGLAAYLSYHHI